MEKWGNRGSLEGLGSGEAPWILGDHWWAHLRMDMAERRWSFEGHLRMDMAERRGLQWIIYGWIWRSAMDYSGSLVDLGISILAKMAILADFGKLSS